MPDVEMISITKKEYDQLQRDVTWLRCLEIAGVDNWDDGGLAREEFQKAYPEEQ